MDQESETHISDLPSVILSNIISKILSPRVRNCLSLTCRDWYFLERQTRAELSLRGNIWVMHELPSCFQQVTVLDLSQCSPWGSSLFQSTANGEEIGNCLRTGFPYVVDLTVYVRDALDIRMVVWIWPDLESIKLVRWNQRPMETEGPDLGDELEGLLSGSKRLKSLNLSKFYCWTEDIPPALQSGASTALNLKVLNLLKLAPNGFKALEVSAITSLCPNLEELYMVCEFDHRLIDSVGDEALLLIGTNCTRLRVLHLVDFSEWGASDMDDTNGDGFAGEDAGVSRQGLEAMFKALPYLEDLVFYLSQNMRDAGPLFEVCASSCPALRALKLSHFHGVCGGPHPDGIARCSNLVDLTLENCGDLADDALRAFSIGCPKLAKLGLRNCQLITKEGLRACVSNLSRSLKNVEISFCKLLPTAVTLKALEPIQATVKCLYLDCVWDQQILDQAAVRASPIRESSSFELPVDTGIAQRRLRSAGFLDADGMDEMIGARTDSFLTPHRLVSSKRRRPNMASSGWHVATTLQTSIPLQSSSASSSMLLRMNDGISSSNSEGNQQPWKSLEVLSLWIPLGEVISPLAAMGLELCPVLHELTIKVEGNGTLLRKPKVRAWGIESLNRYPKLEKLELDLSEVTGFAFSAPMNYTDLSLWERHYLVGIDNLQLTELDYWPPSEKEGNRRSLSLPAVGLLSQCARVRKLFVHGTAHEHFLTMLNRCPCLRDVQLRGDYYPAPETISCQRFESAVAKRGFPD
jgi:hypothetical protein